MMKLLRRLLTIVAAVFVTVASMASSRATPSEVRLALVIGNGSYQANALTTPVKDAALIAQTLKAEGFQVTAEHDLSGENLRKAFSSFDEKIRNAGPDAVAVVYFAGYGLQLEGENYLFPVDASSISPKDAPVRAMRLSEQMRLLATFHLKAIFIVLDAARANSSLLSGPPPAGGLAWVDPGPNMLIAFNAAPGTVASDVGDGYGAYASALAEMIRGSGQTPSALFDRVRLRVSELTKGAQVPWDASKIEVPFVFNDRNSDSPARTGLPDRITQMRGQSLLSLGKVDAYFIALVRDTYDGYSDFLADYGQDAQAKRIQALLAARREALTWWRTYQANVPDAYWTYLERYPQGPHAGDARSLLSRLGAPTTPGIKFSRMEYDIPPPLPDELPYVDRTVLMLGDPQFAFSPPPPLPDYFLGRPLSKMSGLAKPDESREGQAPSVTKFAPVPTYAGVPAGAPLPSSAVVSSGVDESTVRGTIDGPIRQNDKAATPSTSQSSQEDIRSEATKSWPESWSDGTKASSRTSGLPESQQKSIDQVSSIDHRSWGPDAGSPASSALQAAPKYPPVTLSPLADNPMSETKASTLRAPGAAVPLPKSRPATLRRPTTVPERLSASVAPSQTSGGQRPPRAANNAQRSGWTSLTRSSSSGQSTLVAHPASTSPYEHPDQQRQVERSPKSAGPPKVVRAATGIPVTGTPVILTPKRPKNPCSIGQEGCD